MLEITVNGKRNIFQPERFPASVLDLVIGLGLTPDHVVAEVNGDLVKQADMAFRRLAAGDKVELVQFVGGG